VYISPICYASGRRFRRASHFAAFRNCSHTSRRRHFHNGLAAHALGWRLGFFLWSRTQCLRCCLFLLLSPTQMNCGAAPSNTYHNLSDSNVDWGQQLLQVKAWRQLHPHDECWFAYIVQGYIAPKAYGIDLPRAAQFNTSTFWPKRSGNCASNGARVRLDKCNRHDHIVGQR